ncbi:DegT/DnrJ/EryC1/StrS family aminotransferase [Desulfovibrio psychrotolerans]|uniref:GDP-perosamine synthase n=1 Tax=Desulfovibrio psychrotolerans TaxID=415242 RepID=A0A7J0BZH4_9BACT|nr:DegT/DnrJ/EryC1/StrS family aminotransferase [Desulfovibrio psychrotolerans]GFM38541.1 perosamine synthetase [Desulfovibrio psychrotolerans]
MADFPLIRPVFDENELACVEQCLRSGHVTQGPFVREFEESFAQMHGVRHAFAVTSCTTALHLALVAAGVSAGDEVIVPAFSWVSTANAVEYVGAKPVFADIAPHDFNINADLLGDLITHRTKAVIAVHLFGAMADMPRIREIAARHTLCVIEDAACAAGASRAGENAGAAGDVGCFSFHPRKVITTGEGGMVTTNSEEIAYKIKVLRNHGITPQPLSHMSHSWQMPEIAECGYNYRMSDIQAAVGVAQLRKMKNILQERQRIALCYSKRLCSCQSLRLPQAAPLAAHTWQSYVVCLKDATVEKRNRIMDTLQQASIESRPGTQAIPRLTYYANKYGLSAAAFPVAMRSEDLSITLPVFHGMSEEQIDHVCTVLLRACEDDPRP